MNIQTHDTVRYPALTQTKLDTRLENQIEPQDPFVKQEYTEQALENPTNFQMYVKASRATKVIVDDLGNVHQGPTYWKDAEFDGFGLPAQGMAKDYCKHWISYGCNNIKEHPKNQHYCQHSQKSCKTNSCPRCHVDWINRQANRSTQRFMKFTKDKKFFFRHIVLSPPPQAKNQSYASLKEWLDKILKVANIKTASIVFHPFRFYDNEKIQPYVSPHFHLIVYDKVTNTTEFYNKTKWLIKNKGDLKKELDIFNCVRYMLSHAGIKKKTHSIRYIGDISYRKLKVEKEPKMKQCPYCYLPLTIFHIVPSKKCKPPPIDLVGLYDPSCFEMVIIEESDREPRIPFYTINEKTQEIQERLLYSFEELLHVKINSAKIASYKYDYDQLKFKTSKDCHRLVEFKI